MSFPKLLRPDSVAVIGASSNPNKVGYAVLSNLIAGGYEGLLYAVNPKADEILGVKCHKSLSEVPGPVDLIIVIVRRDFVVPVLNEAGAKKVPSAIIITAGFGETGPEGKKLQVQVAETCKRHHITMVGPNCLGLINPWHKLNASFGGTTNLPGAIGLVSQSGALITSIQDWAAANKIGFSVIASIGNKATVDEVGFMNELVDDPNTKVMAAYLEEISRGQEFMKVAERISKVKPIVILKSGKTASGAKAASSHTGSLAGSDVAYDCAFERTGVIRADSIETLFDVSTALAYQPLPKNDRIAVITNAGGPGIMMTDALELKNLRIAQLSDHTKDELRKHLPAAASVNNPVDVLGDAPGDRYGKALEILLASDEVDSVIVILTPQTMTETVLTAEHMIAHSQKHGKPIFGCFMGSDMIADGVRKLQDNGIPQYPIPERAARAMYEIVQYSRYKRRPLRAVERFSVNKNPVRKIIRSYRTKEQFEIGEYDAKAIMKAYNFELPPGILANSVDEAVRFGDEVGYPLAMKISSPDILHKSDVGGVRVGLKSAGDVEDAFELMMLRIQRQRPNAELRGVLLEKMVSSQQEIILGMKKDSQFGPMLMFGLGGIFVEVLKDVTFSLAPVTYDEAMRMMQTTKTYKLLTGARGRPPVDIPSVVECIQRMSQLVSDFSDIEEIDINPLMVGLEGDGAVVVDARMVISKE